MFKKRQYDVFISFKNSYKGRDTTDKLIAHTLYKYLSKKRLKVFYSPVTLKKLGKDNWEDEINLAIHESKVFIALATQKLFMESTWTQKERTSFLALKYADDLKAIYSYVISPMTMSDLPDDIKAFECFQHKEDKELERLYTYINNHINGDPNQPNTEISSIDYQYLEISAKDEFEKIIKLDKKADGPFIVFLIGSTYLTLLIALIGEEIITDDSLFMFLFYIGTPLSFILSSFFYRKNILDKYSKDIIKMSDKLLKRIIVMANESKHREKSIYNKLLNKLKNKLK